MNLEVPLKPLNLHSKILEIENEDQLKMSKVVVSGPELSISESLQWMSHILPEVPSMVSQDKLQLTIRYQSSFVKSFLVIHLSEQTLEFKTDNYSVLTIIKVSLNFQTPDDKNAGPNISICQKPQHLY